MSGATGIPGTVGPLYGAGMLGVPVGGTTRPSSPSRALHTSGAFAADVALRVIPKPYQAPLAPTNATAGPIILISTCS